MFVPQKLIVRLDSDPPQLFCPLLCGLAVDNLKSPPDVFVGPVTLRKQTCYQNGPYQLVRGLTGDASSVTPKPAEGTCAGRLRP